MMDAYINYLFKFGGAGQILDCIVGRLAATTERDGQGMFQARAIALLSAIVPPLVWLRDVKRVPLDEASFRLSLATRNIWALAVEKRVAFRGPETGEVTEITVDDIPDRLVHPLRSYLDTLPGYDVSQPPDNQVSDYPARHHNYTVLYPVAALTYCPVGGD